MGGEVKEKATEIASKNEQIVQLQLENKELTDLQEELQAKNQQVKQYKKQVDSYKAELERCQKELERCHGEQKHLQERVGAVSLSNRNTHCTLPLCVMPRYLCLPNWVRPST